MSTHTGHVHTHKHAHTHTSTHTLTQARTHSHKHTRPHMHLSGLSWGPRKLDNLQHGLTADSAIFHPDFGCPPSQPGAAAEHPDCPPVSILCSPGCVPALCALADPDFPTLDQAVASRPDRGPAGLWEGKSLLWLLEPWYRVQSGVSVGCPSTKPAALL